MYIVRVCKNLEIQQNPILTNETLYITNQQNPILTNKPYI